MHRLRWPIVATLIAVVMLAACGDDDTGEATPPDDTPDANVLLQDAATDFEGLASFAFHLTHEKGSTPIVLNLEMTEAEGELVSPDRMRADVEARSTQLGNARVEVSVVTVGDTTKITNPFIRSQWLDVPGIDLLDDIFDPARGVTAVLRGFATPTVAGSEDVNGAECWRIEGTVESAALVDLLPRAEGGRTVQATAWIAKDGGRAIRVRLEGAVGPDDEDGTIRTLTLSRFDESFDIELP